MQDSEQIVQRIAIIGFGEAGGILGAELVKAGCAVRAFDIVLDAPSLPTAQRMRDKAHAAGVQLCANVGEAIIDAQVILSAVTANSAGDVAQTIARHITRGQWFLDINSISPDAKRGNAKVIDAAGGRYVDAAVMAPVPPQRLKVPMLLGGADAARVSQLLNALGMNTQVASRDVGVASAIKMCRSIMIKGLEALAVECLFTARRYGVEDEVLHSLHASFPSLGFDGELPNYLISRVAEHGRRRAAELREVAVTVNDVGIDPLMASAIARRQDALVDAMEAAGLRYSEAPFSWRQWADALAKVSGK